MISRTRQNADSPDVQADKFHSILEGMAAHPQDYISLGGWMRTILLKESHGLAFLSETREQILGTHTMFAKLTWQSVIR